MIQGRAWLLIHRWAGLVLGLFLALQGLLGAYLVVAESVDEWLHPQLLQSASVGNEPIGWAEAYKRVAEVYPERHLWLIVRAQEPDAVYRAILDSQHGPRVYVDAYSGKVLGERSAFSTLETPVRVLHTGEIGGPWLETFIGVLAIALLGLTLTGVVVWWPGRRRLRQALRFSTATFADVVRDSHRWAGLLGFWLIGLIAISGIYLIFHHVVQDATNAMTGEPEFPPPLALKPNAGPAGSSVIETLVKAARTAVPEADITLMSFPAEAGKPAQVRLRYPGEWHPIGNSTVLLHPGTARVLAVYDFANAGIGHYALDHLYPLHIGVYGGTTTRVLHFAAGLLPALFFGTGFFLWWRRRRRQRDRGRRSVHTE